MKKILWLYYIILMVICPVFIGVGSANAGVEDFYFSDFTADYYLSRAEDGTSKLKVVESFTAEFPDYAQNKGICRQIPIYNQNNQNLTLPYLSRENLSVTRNGQMEPIYSIDVVELRQGDFYDVCTGTDEYVLGRQTYVFEYEFVHVVTEFNENGREFQELYWDTNGNGSLQRFDSVTARLHFEEPDVFVGQSWCYVGSYGESGQDRCTITKIDDGLEFIANNLAANENLTFDVELAPESYDVTPLAPEQDYFYLWATLVFGALCLAWIVFTVIKYVSAKEKQNYYKGLFVAPQFQPNHDYSLAEMAEVYIGKKKDAKVAMILEMVVGRKIEFVKNGRSKWSINVKNLDGLEEENIDLLTILNDGTRPAAGDSFELKAHTASNRLITLRKSMESKIVEDLKKDELVENNYRFGHSVVGGVGNAIVMTILLVPFIMMVVLFVLGMLSESLGHATYVNMQLMYVEECLIAMAIMAAVSVFVTTYLNGAKEKYAKHTKKGLDASNYMEGLKLYIGMAEAERLKMLQSVDGADTSPNGIVHIYEKLLPYAAVFGLEESWMREMKEYCEVEDITEPDYLMAGLAASEITRAMNRASSYATSSTVMSSSGGSSSSGFSGGGGGGFSGGGGGGGGVGGR